LTLPLSLSYMMNLTHRGCFVKGIIPKKKIYARLLEVVTATSRELETTDRQGMQCDATEPTRRSRRG
jgi:metal-sulfur cluster biosynthetic enzyme